MVTLLLELQKKIGYYFSNVHLLREALIHPSARHTHDNIDYERFEFLGDSLLSFLISEILFLRFDISREENLSTMRTKLVCGDTLALIGGKINIQDYLIMSAGEDRSGGRLNPHNIENAMEALIAAVYIDGGVEAARKVVLLLWSEFIDDPEIGAKDHKTLLYEWSQSSRPTRQIKYTLTSYGSVAHEQEFRAELAVNGFESVVGHGRSKKAAEKAAAELFFRKNPSLIA
jgi:ribonuclease III